MTTNVQVPPTIHQAFPLADPEAYPPTYQTGFGPNGGFQSYNEAISFVELYSTKTTITTLEETQSKQTMIEVRAHAWTLPSSSLLKHRDPPHMHAQPAHRFFPFACS